jgi:xylulokinase
MPELLLGIDVGTYSSKGVLVTPAGKVLAAHTVPHKMDIPQPGWAEQDADAVWWADVVTICQVLLSGGYSGADVAGVALSAIGPCMLPLDAEGRPLRPGILYGVDARASDQIDQLNNEIGVDEIFAFSKMALSSQAVGPKILWMRQNEPDLWAKTAHITTASSYLIYRMTGEHVIDKHTSSHYMPLFDMEAVDWSERYMDVVGVTREMLPRTSHSDKLAGHVSASGAAETGLKAGTPVAVGAVDALSEAVSVGAVNPGDLMMMYGSTAFFILIQTALNPHPLVWTVAGAFEGHFNIAAGMATTGSLTRWFRDELAPDLPEETAYATLFKGAASVPPGANGLLMLPYFSGERTPINDPHARGVIAGLSLSTTRADMYRAALESVAYGVRHNIDTFREMGASVQRIVAVGGGTQSDTWLQIVSDVAGVEQVVPKQTIGASYGDAFLVGVAAGLLKQSDLDGWVEIDHTITPNPDAKTIYDPLFANFLDLYQQTKPIVHRLGGRDA